MNSIQYKRLFWYYKNRRSFTIIVRNNVILYDNIGGRKAWMLSTMKTQQEKYP